jgi:hypothetical protein
MCVDSKRSTVSSGKGWITRPCELNGIELNGIRGTTSQGKRQSEERKEPDQPEFLSFSVHVMCKHRGLATGVESVSRR